MIQLGLILFGVPYVIAFFAAPADENPFLYGLAWASVLSGFILPILLKELLVELYHLIITYPLYAACIPGGFLCELIYRYVSRRLGN